MSRKKPKMGFKQALEYVLDLLCYSYYCKSDNLVDDVVFDQLEKLYCKMFTVDTAPSRAMEREECYTNGIRFIYEYLKTKDKNNERN